MLTCVAPKPRLSHFVFVFEMCFFRRFGVENVFSKKTAKTCVLCGPTNCLARRIRVLALRHCWGGRPRWRARAFFFFFFFFFFSFFFGAQLCLGRPSPRGFQQIAKLEDRFEISSSWYFEETRQPGRSSWCARAFKFFFFLLFVPRATLDDLPNNGEVRGHEFVVRDSWSAHTKRKFWLFFSKTHFGPKNV